MTKFDYQVAIVGGGPAGSSAAITLSQLGYDVVLIESSHYQSVRVGETLPPSVQPILYHLGVWEGFKSLKFKPSFGTKSAWGSSELSMNDFIFNPHGQGWHLDRPHFDSFLAHSAAEQGATLLTSSQVTTCTYQDDGIWSLTLRRNEEPTDEKLTTQAVIQATGRQASLSRSIQAQRKIYDHLVGIAVQYRNVDTTGSYTLIESTQDGWWYSAPLPSNIMMVMFMTDADLCQKNCLSDATMWQQHLNQTIHTHTRIGKFERMWKPRIFSAISQRLTRPFGVARWLACGDAAMSVDPLSGSGIVRALNTGLVAGEVMAKWLDGNQSIGLNYTQWLNAEFADYCKTRNEYYALETRWSNAPFWQRRLRQV